MNWTDLVLELGRHEKPLAFIFAAEVSSFVEKSEYGLNADLSFDRLKDVLAPEPKWLGRRNLLKDAWPDDEATCDDELINLALLSCKAMLGLGARIPDGPFTDMQQRFDELFPEIATVRLTERPEEFETQKVHVAINATGSHETRFQAGPGLAPGC
ncbi:MAG TPA: hypothetical protein VGL97_22355 [Bryobacteraceae bacterium]